MANEIANLVVEISADARKLNQELKLSEANIQSFSAKAATNFKLIGAAVGGAVIGGLTVLTYKLLETAKALDELGDTAQSIGLTTKELQRLQFQANLAGSSAEGVTQSFVFMENAIADGAKGAQLQVDAFNKLGINVNALKQLRPEQQFEQIAEAFKKIKNVNDQTDISRTIFGRAGVDQINLLNSSLKDSAALFEKFGLGLSKSQEENVDKLDKSGKLLSRIFDDFGEKIAAGVSPAFDAIATGINNTIEHFGGLGGAAEYISIGVINAFSAMADAADLLQKPFKALGILWEGVKLAGTNIGTTIGQLKHGAEIGDAAFRGEASLPLPGDRTSRDAQTIANEINDAQAKKFADAIGGASTVNQESKAEVLIDNIKKAFKGSGDEAAKAADNIKKYKSSLDSLNSTAAGGGKTALEESLKKAGGANFSDEENQFLQQLKGFSKVNPAQSEQQLQDSIINKLSTLNTPEANQAISDIFSAIGEKNHPGSRLGNLKPGGGVSGFGSISDENGKFMSVGTPQNIVVTVVLVPDEGRLFNAVVDSQIFQRAVIDTSNKNLLNVTRSDRS
jgi:hypothetical protein